MNRVAFSSGHASHSKYRTMKIILFFFVLLCSASNASGQWQQTSGPFGGGVSDFVFIDSTILAATVDDGNGVYASIDGGKTWQESGMQGVRISHMTSHGNTVIASSTQNLKNETDTIYQSLDAGNSWFKVYTIPNTDGISSICYYNSHWFISALGTNGGIYVADEYGIHWSVQKPSFDFTNPVILLSTVNTLYAGTTDNGNLDIFLYIDSTSIWRKSFVDSSKENQFRCAGISLGRPAFGIRGGILSTYDGNSWGVDVNYAKIDPTESILAVAADSSIYSIAVSSFNGIYKNEQGTYIWSNVDRTGLPLNASHFYSIGLNNNGFNPRDGMLYLGSSAGTMSTSTFTIDWQYITHGIRDASISNLAASQGGIFAATERGVSFSPNQGLKWYDPQVSSDLNDVKIAGFLNSTNAFFAYGAGLYSWQSSYWNPVDSGEVTALAEGLSERIFATRDSGDSIHGTSRLDITDNGGAAWINRVFFKNSIDTIFHFLPHCLCSNDSAVVIAIQQLNLSKTASTVYRLFRTTNNGLSWNVTGIPNSPAFLYFADSVFYMGTYGSGLLSSRDNGVTWTQLSGLPSDVDVTEFLKIRGTLFAAVTPNLVNQTKGLYLSTDDGLTWRNGNDSTTNIVGPLATDGEFLYSGGPSVWRRSLQGLTSVVAEQQTLKPNPTLEVYPNPAAELIRIHFPSSPPPQGTFSIYNGIGEIIFKQDVRGADNSGDISFSVRGIAGGVYHAKFTDQSGMVIATSQFIVK
jgi:hypothetical protein